MKRKAESYADYWLRTKAWSDARRRKLSVAGLARPDYVIRAERRSLLKHSYGMTLADYDNMLIAQESGCAICGKEPKPGKRTRVDHNHETGKVRGLLCARCNVGLSYVEDTVRLAQMQEYLRSYN